MAGNCPSVGVKITSYARVPASGVSQGVYCLRRNGQMVLRCTWWGTWGKDLVVVGYVVVIVVVVVIGLLRRGQKVQKKLKRGENTVGRKTGA